MCVTVTPDTYDTEVAVLQHRYKKLCQTLGVVPLSSLLKQVGRGTVVLRDICLAPLELKAALTLLVVSPGPVFSEDVLSVSCCGSNVPAADDLLTSWLGD